MRFCTIVYDYYALHARDLPWRTTYDPYGILVSEIMLQQTQVSRVLTKYPLFMSEFPAIKVLAKASLRKVLEVWQGMGYNRRALALKKLSQYVIEHYRGRIPSDREALRKLPGIGSATAGSICAFAFNKPEVFIETNIRSVFIHHFFKDRDNVSDTELLPWVEKALDRENPRRWYSALMDYGVHLKAAHGNPSRKSSHYARQSRFEGSDRQMRGRILKVLVENKQLTEKKLLHLFNDDLPRAQQLINDLCGEDLIHRQGVWVSL